MKIGYARVSTQDQTTDLQIDALKKAGCERIFQEKASGAKEDRPQLAAALEYMREGDVLVVWKLDRLARSTKQLMNTVDDFRERGIQLISVQESIDTTSTTGKLLFGILATLAEFERDVIRDRVNSGLAAARQRGRVGGRPKVDADKLNQAVALVNAGYSTAKASKAAGISRATLCRHLASKTLDAVIETGNGFEASFETKKRPSKMNSHAFAHAAA
jgi:DNA invertase Pin-like site-specific DNA recombinase